MGFLFQRGLLTFVGVRSAVGHAGMIFTLVAFPHVSQLAFVAMHCVHLDKV